jgi:hypothetical protein
LATRPGDYVTAISYHEQAQALRRQIDDRRGQAQSLRSLRQAAIGQARRKNVRSISETVAHFEFVDSM